MILFSAIFLLCLIALLHTYIFYPRFVLWFGKWKINNQKCYFKSETLPNIILLMAAYNEEKVIGQKMESILKINYPKEKIKLYIGSDASTDQTDSIIQSYTDRLNITLKRLHGRSGKTKILNVLFQTYLPNADLDNDILLLTDANVMFHAELFFQLAKHFKNEEIGIVGANFVNTGITENGIAHQEKQYISSESAIKYNEGKIWGTMMGTFGGCYAVRAQLFPTIPNHFIVDDFFVTMYVFEKNKKAILEPEALCYEDVSTLMSEEFRRKARVSSGNFQNLFHYKHLLFSSNLGLTFSYISHKVLRWLGPFFILFLTISAFVLYLVFHVVPMKYFILALLGFYALYFIDIFLSMFHIHIKLFRLVSYFLAMNVALFKGFFMYQKGIKSSIWTPTKREI